jgi:hypothetical protein
MRKVYLTICIVICYVTCSIASPNIDDAMKLINKFLEAEFTGNQAFRINNAIYSAKREKVINEKYSPMIGEIFYWESEALCVVDHYEVTNIKMVGSKAIADVTFQEFGCTEGYGDIPLIKTNKRSFEKYSLEYKKGRWWVNDPPIPRVSRKALIDYNDVIIRRMKDFVMEKGTDVQKKYYYNLINTNDMLKENIEGADRNIQQRGK